MELTKKERINMMLNYQILEKLTDDPKEKEKIQKHIEVLRNGYSLEYSWYPFEMAEEDVSKDDCRLARRICQMYYDLWFSWDKLENKDGITEEDVAFPGFDANNEMEIKCYAEHFLRGGAVIHDGPIWPEWFKEEFLPNPHFPTLQKYKMMLKVHEKLMDVSSHGSELKPEHIREILDAGKPKKKGE